MPFYNEAIIDPLRLTTLLGRVQNLRFAGQEQRSADHLLSAELPCAGTSSLIHSEALPALVILKIKLWETKPC